ncbi:MAG: hypothetical protein ACKODX_06255 [Gemmata sp.]|jgi:DNA-binding NtrC family response regulator
MHDDRTFGTRRPPQDEPAAGTPSSRACDGPGVLVVNDDVLMRLMLRAGLEQHGLPVWLAAGAGEAASVYRAHANRIAVVLIDVETEDGLKALAALRGVSPGVRVCFVGGAGKYDPDVFCGASRLAWPFLMSDLAATIRRVARAAPSPAAGRLA